MVIFLFGEDTYRSQKKLKEIIAKYKEENPSQLSFKQLEGKGEESSKMAKNFLETQSMFAETRLLVWEDFFTLPKQEKLDLLEWLEKNNLYSSEESIVVIYEKGSPDKRKKSFKELKKKAQSQEFEPLEGKKLRSWIEKKFDEKGLPLSYSALGLLVERFGGNLWAQNQAIKKVTSFSRAQGKDEVGTEEVRACTKKALRTDIFKTIDAIAAKDRKKALNFLSDHLQAGEHELRLLAMFSYQFRNLLQVKSLQNQGITGWKKIKNKTDLSFFVVKKTSKYAQNFSEEELKSTFIQLYQIDKGIKTGKIKNPRRALEEFIIKATKED